MVTTKLFARTPTLRTGRLLRILGPLAVLCIMVLLGPFLNNYFLQIGVYVCVYTIVAQSLALVWGHLGSLSLAQTAFFGTGGYVTAILLVRTDISSLGALALSVVIPVVFSIAFGLLALRKPGHGFIMISLISLFILEVLARDLSDFTGGASGLPAVPSPEFGIAGIRVLIDSYLSSYYFAIAMLGIVLLWHGWVLSGRNGRAIHAIRDDEILAGSVGVPVYRYRVLILAASAASAGLAGFVFATFLGFVGPEVYGPYYLLLVLAITVAGGARSTFGVLVAGLALTIAVEAGRIDPEHQMLIYGVFLLILVRFAPRGIPITVTSLWRRIRGRKASARAIQDGRNDIDDKHS